MRVGMRWWLAAAFAAVAATTAIAVAQLSSQQSADAFRERAQSLAAGNSFQAAIELRGDDVRVPRLADVAATHRVSMYIFDAQGQPLSPPVSRGVALADIPEREDAVAAALQRRRFIHTDDQVQATIVAVPFRDDENDAQVLLTYASHPELADELGILQQGITRAAWLALLLGGAIGAVIASLIALRLARIGEAAAAIEAGDLEKPLRSDFPDELGALAATFDRMRLRLRGSFMQLEAERDRLEELLERLRDGVVAFDERLEVKFANGAAQALLGVAPGRPLEDPWPDSALREFAAGLFRADGREELRVEGGAEHVYSVAGVQGRSGDVAILVIRDLTEHERRERAEREFVANASHELRTPLTTILGAVEILQAGAKENGPDRDRFLGHIEREAGRLVRLTRALLVLARAQTRQQLPSLTRVEIRPLLEQIAESIGAIPDVDVDVRCPADLGVFAEPDLLEQAVANLVANAAEHTHQGQIVLAAGNGNGHVRIEVRDSGPGIAPELRRRIFDRFYRPVRSSGDGFGLGLAIVRQAVQAQGGTLELADAPEGGTAVSILLPGSRS